MSALTGGSTAPTAPRLGEPARWRHVLAVLGLVCVPLVVQASLFMDAWHRGIVAIDFEQTLLPAAEKLASGESPYPAYGYPPLVAFGLAPFAYIPSAGIVFTALLACALVGSLYALGIRDWRCYGAVFCWAPTFHALQTANVTTLLLLGFALCWRWRERTRPVALAGGLTIAAKIICWPLAVWLVATRRSRTAVLAVVTAIGVTLGLWGILGFSGLTGYPSSLDKLGTEQSARSYTVSALLGDAGLPTLGRLLGAALVVTVLAACVVAGRRGNDRASFALCVVAAIVASPIVWLHSFVLLVAPVALLRPRFSAVWLLPALMWLGSGSGNGDAWQTALVLTVAATTALAVLAGNGRTVSRPRRPLLGSARGR